MNIADQLIHTTVRIECHTATGAMKSGTGFICQFCEREEGHVPALVTNKHVVEGATLGVFHITTANDQGQPSYGQHVAIQYKDLEAACVKHPDKDVDLAALVLEPVLKQMRDSGRTPYYKRVHRELWANDEFMNELSAVEEIVMVGYPNGLWDSRNNLPLVRRGTTATPLYIDYEDRPEFVIDCACFPGSSGSPIFLMNSGAYTAKAGGVVVGSRLKLLGVLWGGPQYTAEGKIKVVPVPSAVQPIALSRIPSNLGYCVKARQLAALEKEFDKLLATELRAEKSDSRASA